MSVKGGYVKPKIDLKIEQRIEESKNEEKKKNLRVVTLQIKM